MKEIISLFRDNLEKIGLFFGTNAAPFKRTMATQLTIRGHRFHFEAYEQVQQAIKQQTKWYQLPRMNMSITNSYYVHLVTATNKHTAVADLFATEKLLKDVGFRRSVQSYLAALYIKNAGHAKKMDATSRALKQQSSNKFASPTLQLTAMLSAREEMPEQLAEATEHYYSTLRKDFKRGDQLQHVTLMLTIIRGTFDAKLCDRIRELAQLIQQLNVKLQDRHYAVICLLALANFKKDDFPKLFALHEEIVTLLKANPKYENTLLIAAQLYTATQITEIEDNLFVDAGDLLFDMCGLMDSCGDGSDGGSDGGGGD
ncbi:DUF4003 family protein [Solibacillus sp. FSL H8-0538]|uniref:DUF4003 family protein n=1 Tax=Solibacillus sp. FSL H8-0538 TaxID=2921400 RepID=UPI0030FC7200